VRGLAKQAAAERIDAHQLTPEGQQVQVGLQDLVLAPLALQLRGGHGLAQLLPHAAPLVAGAPVLVQQAGQLHGDGAGPARAAVPQLAPGGGRHGLPVHAAVGVEALVLADQQRQAQRGRGIAERHPLATAHLHVGAQALQQLALARQDVGFRGLKTAAHLLRAGQGLGHQRHQQAAQPEQAARQPLQSGTTHRGQRARAGGPTPGSGHPRPGCAPARAGCR